MSGKDVSTNHAFLTFENSVELFILDIVVIRLAPAFGC
jgi:hypothetical protein